jgi:hypothetical protein
MSDEKAKVALIEGAIDLSMVRRTEPAPRFVPEDEDSVLPDEMQPRDVLRPGYDDWTRRWYTQNDFGDRQLASRYMLLAFESCPNFDTSNSATTGL